MLRKQTTSSECTIPLRHDTHKFPLRSNLKVPPPTNYTCHGSENRSRKKETGSQMAHHLLLLLMYIPILNASTRGRRSDLPNREGCTPGLYRKTAYPVFQNCGEFTFEIGWNLPGAVGANGC